MQTRFVRPGNVAGNVWPSGWRGWFVDGLMYPWLRVRPRTKPVDFHDAENQQRPCRTIIRHVCNGKTSIHSPLEINEKMLLGMFEWDVTGINRSWEKNQNPVV
ncbi:hypothetical protein TNCV_2979941 [Trichonephila clavipes]|nr:hypothetical protein TNCV_2979941 [Trichonephila clavipes]